MCKITVTLELCNNLDKYHYQDNFVMYYQDIAFSIITCIVLVTLTVIVFIALLIKHEWCLHITK